MSAIPIIVCTLFMVIISTYISALFIIRIEKKFGFLCKDVHKPQEYLIPCIGGFPLYIGIVIGLAMLYVFGVISYHTLAIFVLPATISLIIGFIDDMINLKSEAKITLGFLPAIPILLLGCYTPRPWVPFIGHARLFMLYPLLILIASTVLINGANMIDTHNGVLPTSTLIVLIFAIVLKLLTHITFEELLIYLLLIVALSTYLIFNIYPAKMFNGNAGAFLIGSLLMVTVVFLRVEFYMILALVPMLINGFYYISSVKGFLQKEKIARPTYVDDRGCIYASKQLHPITFIKILLSISDKPLSEKEMIYVMFLVYLSTSFLSFVITFALGYS